MLKVLLISASLLLCRDAREDHRTTRESPIAILLEVVGSQWERAMWNRERAPRTRRVGADIIGRSLPPSSQSLPHQPTYPYQNSDPGQLYSKTKKSTLNHPFNVALRFMINRKKFLLFSRPASPMGNPAGFASIFTAHQELDSTGRVVTRLHQVQ